MPKPQDPVQPLLVKRAVACKMLGVESIQQMMRLEENGILTPIRLNKKSESGRVFYNYAQVVALASPANNTEVEKRVEKREALRASKRRPDVDNDASEDSPRVLRKSREARASR